MEASIEKACLEEISSLVNDSLEKVTIKKISNNWSVSLETAKSVLLKWLDHNKQKDVKLEYLVQGTNTKGMHRVSVVSESINEQLPSKWKNFSSWVYSVELRSNSKSLDLPEKFEAIQVKNIRLVNTFRDLKITEPVVPSTSSLPDTTKIKTPFGMVKPISKEESKSKGEEKPVKIEQQQVKKEEVKQKEENVKAEESKAQKKASPNTSENNAKSTTANKKDAKAPGQKGNISTFFSKAPANKKESAPQPSTSVKHEVMVKEDNAKKKTRSPSPSPKEPPKKKQATKKMKLKDIPNKKRTRIQVIDDSSEEESEPEVPEEPESKFIKFDREITPEKEPSPVSKKEATPEKKEAEKLAKNKAKRWVTKRYQTDDGFIKTEKILEEYSASEDENDENRKKNSPPKKETVVKKTPEKRSAKVKDTVKTKQGSIMSFFTKK